MAVILPVGIAAALAVNAYLHRRLVVAAQPLRLELAERGEELLRSAGLPSRIREHVEFMLSHAFGIGWLLLAALVVAPFAIPVMIVRGEMERDAQAVAALSANARAEYNQLAMLHSRIVFATHPGLMTLNFLEMLLIAGPLVLLSGALSGRLLPEVNQTSILQAIESEASLLSRRKLAA